MDKDLHADGSGVSPFQMPAGVASNGYARSTQNGAGGKAKAKTKPNGAAPDGEAGREAGCPQSISQQVQEAFTTGDYRKVAEHLDSGSRRLVEACEIAPGDLVLDVAAGTGNAAIWAAKNGARVVASDLTPRLLQWGRSRADSAGLDIEWVSADALRLPFADDLFDCVTIAFAAFMIPHPDVLSRELCRVVKPAGKIGMVNWSEGGFVHQMASVTSRFLGRNGNGDHPVASLGSEQSVRSWFNGHAAPVRFDRLMLRNEFASFEAFRSHYESNIGTLKSVKQQLAEEEYDRLFRELQTLVTRLNLAVDGRVALELEYLLAVGRRTGRGAG